MGLSSFPTKETKPSERGVTMLNFDGSVFLGKWITISLVSGKKTHSKSKSINSSAFSKK